MNLKQLEYFVDLIEHEMNLTRCAQRFFISQSAVTKQLCSLEEELGIELFDRTKHRLFLTYDGRFFYPYAKKILDAHKEALDHVQLLKNGLSGNLRLGMILRSDMKMVLPLLSAFHARYPDIEISVYSATHKQLMEDLEKNRCDIILALQHPEGSNYICAPIARYPLIVLVSTSDPLSVRESVHEHDLNHILFDTRINDETRSGLLVDDCIAKIACGQGQAIYHSFVYDESMSEWIKSIPLAPYQTSSVYLIARRNYSTSQAKLLMRFAQHAYCD